jgi:acyl carrier protein
MSVDRDVLLGQVSNLIRQHSLDPDADLSEVTKLDDLGVDSIDLMEIVFRLEEDHGHEINVAGLVGQETLGDIVDYAFKTLTA